MSHATCLVCEQTFPLQGSGNDPFVSVAGTKVFCCSEQHRAELENALAVVNAGYGVDTFSPTAVETLEQTMAALAVTIARMRAGVRIDV